MSGSAHIAETLADALERLAAEPMVPLAGGTDLMVRHRRHAPIPIRLAAPPLFIARIPELRSIMADEGNLIIGAAVTLSEVATHRDTPPGLKAAIAEFASPAIRNAGTIGGNICNASPAADTLPFLYAVGASVTLQCTSGRRTIPVASFITAPGTTVRRPDELLTAITIPRTAAPFFRYRKVAPRLSNALSKLSVYAQADSFTRRTDGQPARVGTFGLAIGAVAPTVVRVPEAEALINGITADSLRGRVGDILALYEPAIRPIDDQRSTATYRRNVALNLIRHILEDELPQFLEHL